MLIELYELTVRILFQIPYIIMLFVAGLPVFFLEIAIGQYAGVGPIKLFGRLAPILRGVGFVSSFNVE